MRVDQSATRSWNIRVSQYECGNLRAPEENCLQYHTAQTGLKEKRKSLINNNCLSFLFLGSFASFNWDTSKTSNLKTELYTQYHLADQSYDICIRRSEDYCAVCYSPEVIHTTPTALAAEGSSFGVSANSAPAPTFSVNQGPGCTGVTTFHATDTSATGYGTVSIEQKKDHSLDLLRIYRVPQ